MGTRVYHATEEGAAWGEQLWLQRIGALYIRDNNDHLIEEVLPNHCATSTFPLNKLWNEVGTEALKSIQTRKTGMKTYE